MEDKDVVKIELTWLNTKDERQIKVKNSSLFDTWELAEQGQL